MGDLATLITSGGGLGALVAIIGYLLGSNRTDRKEYQEAIDRAEKRADDAEKRTDTADARCEALQQAVDEARTARRTAEDRADLLARELARCRCEPERRIP
ncbi:hypothetical protein [Micromonospora sp. WMMD980]|uniref:hypothetical protein n=1 Tax=Micromonospora sp. WMMD980 TaxID=3016088 RepID=UPI002416A70B|nr:hypothetical protein [Micromonospora sp. WMMD980]MDG4801731.1 hypothetical protein [Micromonospora sp. WMMD980]